MKLTPASWLLAAGFICLAQTHGPHPAPPGPALPELVHPLKGATTLIREGKTDQARAEISEYLKQHPDDAEGWYQMARAHLTDFFGGRDPSKKRLSLDLAMEALSAALKRNPDHLYALRTKSVIHARAELLHYDPNLAYELAARVIKLQPYANEFLINLSEWLSGEVRFTEEHAHRVPHDPQTGLDRTYNLMERVIAGAMPYSPEEAAALFMMAKTLSRRGNYRESIDYYKQALVRSETLDQKLETLRELGASYYRLGSFNDAAASFYQVLQSRNNSVDQWLLKVAMDQLGPSAPKLPEMYVFPAATARPSAVAELNLEFRDVAPDLGINRFDGNGTCGWGDYDGDGDLDLFLAGSGTFMAVFRNDGGTFKDVTEEVGLKEVPSGYSLNLVDYDGDGKLDLYASFNGWSGPMKNRLFRNIGGKFEDVTEKSGAGDPGSGFVSLWGDLDNDGDLDLAIANGVLKDGSVPQLYRNNGDGTFTNVTKQAGIDEPPTHGTIGIALGDYDKDGDLDILMNGLDTSPNRLYRNDGPWKFTEVSRTAGVGQAPHNGFVCFFFDYNNDGWPDILTTALAPWDLVVEGLKRGYAPAGPRAVHPDATHLFRNNRDGTFTDVTFEAKLYYPAGTMGAGVADVNNDGFLDVYIGTGDPQLSRLEPNRLFLNNGDGTFSDVTSIVGFARPGNKGHGVTFADYDEDGDLDIYAQLGGHYQGDFAYNAFYRNVAGNRNNWIEVDLEGEGANTKAIGAQITVRCGDFLVYREVKGSAGFGSTDPYRVHMGLGKHERIDSLKVRWPSGTVREFNDLPPNQIIAISSKSEAVRKLK